MNIKEQNERVIKDGRYDDIMIDIESLDTKPSAIILSIGARAFNLKTGEIEPNGFYTSVQVNSQQEAGRTHSIETAMWWGAQDPVAQSEAFSGNQRLSTALHGLIDYFREYCYTDRCVWAKSPVFDLAILKDAMKDILDNELWHYTNERDVRTYVWAIPIKTTRRHYLASHIAIEDVDNQIKVVCAAYKSIHEEESNTRTAEVLDSED